MSYKTINGLQLIAVETGVLVVLFVLAILVIRMVPHPWKVPSALDWLLRDNSRAVLFVIASALLSRALLLPIVGVPEPRINDEYSYLLVADTFVHGRLTNPTPTAWEHFETFHVNMTPTYHSKHAVGQGIALAFGQVTFGKPWVGVYLSTGLLCGAICWALQAFVPPAWALLGGLLAVARLALFCYWMNSYWGGSVAALGGALALGAIVRLFDVSHTSRVLTLYASLFAAALIMLAISRPYEGLAFALPLVAYFCYQTAQLAIRRETTVRPIVLPVALIGVIGIGLMAYYNQKTTGNPLLLPHALNERVYSPFPLFLTQRPKPAFSFRDPVFEKFFKLTDGDYEIQKTKTLPGLIGVEGRRFFANWFFYVGPAFSLPVLLGFLLSLRVPRLRITLAVTVSTGIALAICIYSMPHYAAPLTIAVYIFAVEGLRYFWRQHLGERAFVIAVCLTIALVSATKQTGSSAINTTFAFPNTRELVAQRLENEPGKHLVVVSYDLERHYPGNELVHNGADFNSEKILWARSKGPQGDRDLCQGYPDRTFWSVTTDDLNLTFSPSGLCK